MTAYLRGSSARLALLVVSLLLTSGLTLPGAATAATAHCPKPRVTYSKAGGETTQFGWLLAPGSNGTKPRDVLQYNVVGGQVICDSVALNNPSKHAVTVQLYSADAYNIAEGGAFAFTAFKDKPKGVGTWFKLPVTRVTVPAGRKADIPIVVQVPTKVTPGDMAGGVVARDTKVRRGKSVGAVKVGVRAGVGVRLYAQVAGLRHPKLSLTKLNLQMPGGLRSRLFGAKTATVSYQVGNAGNVRLSAKSGGKVTTRTRTVTLAKHQFAELLPGSQPVVVKEKVHGLRWSSLTGRVRAKVTVTAVGAKPVTREVAVRQVPWLSFLGLVLLIGLSAGAWHLRRGRVANSAPAGPAATQEQEEPEPAVL